jgi:hypothetical protein
MSQERRGESDAAHDAFQKALQLHPWAAVC